MRVVVRKAKLEDVPKIVEMWKEFMKYHDEVATKKERKLREHLRKRENAHLLFRRYVEKSARSENSVIHLAYVDGRLAGYSILHIKDNVPVFRIRKLGYMSDLFVREGFRGFGIASKLKEEAFRWFRRKGIRYVSIAVLKNNEYAHSIYRKWGFFDYKIEMRRKI